MESSREQLTEKVDRLIAIKQAQQHLKREQEILEGELLRNGLEDLRDTKFKTVCYEGQSERASITIAESLKLIYPSFLREVFGTAYEDAISEETSYKLSKPASRMLTGLWTGGYCRMTVAEVVQQLPSDAETKAALLKKLKGANYATDKKNLMSIGRFEEKEAEGYAYFIAEAAIWESFSRIMSANKVTDEKRIQYLLDQIGGACIVEELPKVAVEITG